jgi:5-methylcytosine-specific restriction endonuclease McrA
MKRRDWTAARAKVDDEGECRVCGVGQSSVEPLDTAHLWPRSLGGTDDPNGTVALCRRCHELFDAHRLNIGHVLRREEQAALVMQCGSLATAMRRVYPIDYRERQAA